MLVSTSTSSEQTLSSQQGYVGGKRFTSLRREHWRVDDATRYPTAVEPFRSCGMCMGGEELARLRRSKPRRGSGGCCFADLFMNRVGLYDGFRILQYIVLLFSPPCFVRSPTVVILECARSRIY